MKTLLTAFLLIFSAVITFAQCDKDVQLTTTKTEYLDGTGTVQRTVDEQSTIEIGKTEILIRPGNADRKMNGTIQSTTCNWSVPYKDGKTVLKALFKEPSGEERHVTLTIEGKEGKVTFLMEVQEMADRKILVTVDSFSEKK
ncbi:hypothetical protein [Larkinella rosea]|uniref:Lipocalin-like domain-containing protein n=1 Tax=Larkinella rosea TaxID=2025312 RepID=A0A3P1BDW8_9BACT|nr:hypothetical protein [Larkinella rosea]RRA98982.1 hypothetical protein EHT25_28795 [Larkinella rosea]